ncbi:MAG: translocation/assembly module TamB domain-containing protein [Roseobacter sp.]
MLTPAAIAQDESEDDGGFLTRTIENALSGAGREVELIGFEGALSSEATFERLTIADARGVWLSLEDVALNWSRASLLRGRLRVRSLTAQSLILSRLPEASVTDEVEEASEDTADSDGFALPDLPVSINVETFEVSVIELGEPVIGMPVELTLNASARFDDEGLFVDLDADRIDDVAGRFAIGATVLRDGTEIAIDLALDEAPEGITAHLLNLPGLPSVNLSVAGQGPLDDFTANIRLATEDAPRLSGQVELIALPAEDPEGMPDRRILADIGGDITALFAPEYRSFFGPDVRLNLNTLLAADGAINVQDFSVASQALDLMGRVSLSGDYWPQLVDIRGQIALADGKDVRLPGADVSLTSGLLYLSFDAQAGNALSGVFDLRGVQHSMADVDAVALKIDGTLNGSVEAIDSLSADITFNADGVAMQDLGLASALGQALEGAVSLAYAEGSPLEVRNLALSGEDYGLSGDAVIALLEDGVPTDLDITVAAQDLSRFAIISGQDLSGAAELSVAGDVIPLTAMFDVSIDGETNDIALGVPQADGVLAGRTTLSLDAARDDTGITVKDLALDGQAIDLAGDVALNGAFWPSLLNLTGRVAQPDGSDVILGAAEEEGITLNSIALDVSYDATRGDTLNGVFDIQDLNHPAARLGVLTLKVDGAMSEAVDTLGSIATDITFDARDLALQNADLASALGRVIQGATTINFAPDAPLEVRGLTLSGPDYGANGEATIAIFEKGMPTDLNMRVVAEDLSRFAVLAGQDLSGAVAISAAGSVSLGDAFFDISVEGEANDVALGIAQADAVLAGRTTLSVVALRDETALTIRDLKIDNDALSATAEGVLGAQDSNISARVSLSDIALVAPQYEGAVLLNAAAKQTEEGWWDIDTDLNAPYDSTVTVKGLATGPDADLVFEIAVPDVQPILPTAQGPLQADGRVWQSQAGYEVDVRAGGPFGASLEVLGLATGPDARVTLSADLPNMGVFMPELSGALALNGEVARQGEDWAVDSRLEGPAGMAADISGTAKPDASAVDIDVAGQVPLALAGPFVAPRSLTGPVSFDIAVNGPPALGSVSGRISTSNVAFSDPDTRIALQNITTQVDIAQSAAQIDVAAGVAAGGQITVGGRVDLVSLVGDLAIVLDNALFVDPNLYAATVDAEINVNGALTGGARIAGDIVLGEVNVTVPETGVTAVGTIPEITHIGAPGRITNTRARAGVIPKVEKASSGPAGPPYPLAIDISAPNQIFIRGRGLNVEMDGDLKIGGDTNNIISSGSFDLVRGRLDIIGKRFDLDEGTVEFAGDFTPYILFVTTTEVPDGTASITVEGPADDPEITFSAVPEVPEDEVLALILFGRYVSELSAFQALQLANGVAQLTGRGGVDLIGGLREGLGLDELDVTTDEAGSTSVSAGKYITDDIYTDVTTNTEDGTDISLNIDLTTSLTGKATVGEDGDSSIGLFFERDY